MCIFSYEFWFGSLRNLSADYSVQSKLLNAEHFCNMHWFQKGNKCIFTPMFSCLTVIYLITPLKKLMRLTAHFFHLLHDDRIRIHHLEKTRGYSSCGNFMFKVIIFLWSTMSKDFKKNFPVQKGTDEGRVGKKNSCNVARHVGWSHSIKNTLEAVPEFILVFTGAKLSATKDLVTAICKWLLSLAMKTILLHHTFAVIPFFILCVKGKPIQML